MTAAAATRLTGRTPEAVPFLALRDLRAPVGAAGGVVLAGVSHRLPDFGDIPGLGDNTRFRRHTRFRRETRGA